MAHPGLKSPQALSDRVSNRVIKLTVGFANAVGLAIAQAHTAAVFNKPGFDLIGMSLEMTLTKTIILIATLVMGVLRRVLLVKLLPLLDICNWAI